MEEIDPDLADRVVTERQAERRRRHLAGIPKKLAILTQDYINAGGDPAILHQIITDNSEPQTP